MEWINEENRESMPRNFSYWIKGLVLAIVCIHLIVGTMIVNGLVYSREKTNEDVATEITRDWGGPLYFDGVTISAGPRLTNIINPTEYTCSVTLATQTLHRGIYEAEVYDADIKLSSKFSKNKLMKLCGNNVPHLCLNIPEACINKLSAATLNGVKQEWSIVDNDIAIKLNLDELPEQIVVETAFTVRGSGGLYVLQVGRNNNITFVGNTDNPSFRGESLPSSRIVDGDNGFKAVWTRDRLFYDSMPRSYGDTIDVADSTEEVDNYVGADFLLGIDRYQKVIRTLKYSFIIILLTYIAVVFVELTLRRRIPLLNYILIGVALVLFYLLLLSFAELMAFGCAYLIASLMTISLIGAYMWMMLKSRKIGLSIAGVLVLIYGACFAMLIADSCALLLGSLLLFVILALLMYATIRVQKSVASTTD